MITFSTITSQKIFENTIAYDKEPLVHRMLSFHFIKDLFASFHVFSISI